MKTSFETWLVRYAIVFSLLLTTAVSVQAMATKLVEPQKVIQGVANQLLKILEQEQELLKKDPARVYVLANDLLVPHVDFSRASNLALGKHWRRANPEQKARFSSQFQRLLVRTYSTALNEFTGLEIRYLPIRMKSGDDRAMVRTEVMRTGARPVDVIYQMHKNGDRWMAYDIKIDGISLVTNYRNSFSRHVRQHGMDGLIDHLTKMNDERTNKKL